MLDNILSKAQQSIGEMYYRDGGTGKTTNITFAMYERMPWLPGRALRLAPC